jgi:hypothetical protein
MRHHPAHTRTHVTLTHTHLPHPNLARPHTLSTSPTTNLLHKLHQSSRMAKHLSTSPDLITRPTRHTLKRLPLALHHCQTNAKQALNNTSMSSSLTPRQLLRLYSSQHPCGTAYNMLQSMCTRSRPWSASAASRLRAHTGTWPHPSAPADRL